MRCTTRCKRRTEGRGVAWVTSIWTERRCGAWFRPTGSRPSRPRPEASTSIESQPVSARSTDRSSRLVVPEGVPGDHLRIGWGSFTDAVLRAVAAREEPNVFFAWGLKAQAALVRVGIADEGPHIVCSAFHPADRWNRFATADPFGKANAALRDCGAEPIDWSLS